MKAAVGGIAVFGEACVAQREARHRRLRAVLRNALDNRQARPAMGAIRKGIAIAPFTGIKHFGGAGRAKGRVGRHLGARRTKPARGDMKAGRQRVGESADLDSLDLRQWRRLGLDPFEQGRDPLLGTPGADQYALAIVQDFAVEPEIARDALHGRAKPDALHTTVHADLDRDRRPGNGIRGAQILAHARTVSGRLTYC
jgi:hypothetical protein